MKRMSEAPGIRRTSSNTLERSQKIIDPSLQSGSLKMFSG